MKDNSICIILSHSEMINREMPLLLLSAGTATLGWTLVFDIIISYTVHHDLFQNLHLSFHL